MRRGRFQEESQVKTRCQWCRAFFMPGRKHAKTCSPKCRKALSRADGVPRVPSPSPSGSRQAAPPRPSPATKGKPAHPWDDIFNPAKASMRLAREILGLAANYRKEDAKRAWMKGCMANHPDGGGDADIMKRIQAAWEYLRDLHRWN